MSSCLLSLLSFSVSVVGILFVSLVGSTLAEKQIKDQEVLFTNLNNHLGVGQWHKGTVKETVRSTKEILDGLDEDKVRVQTGGRPSVNRELAYKLLSADPPYSTKRLMRVLKCSSRMIRKLRGEMKEKGIVSQEEIDISKMEKSQLDFDDETIRAVGTSFYDWLKGSIKRNRDTFLFNKKVWEGVFDRCSLILLKDQSNPLGDQMCAKFLKVFGGEEEKSRIRDRKVTLRYLFRFLGRNDLCDRYLTVREGRDPRARREIPDLSMTGFPQKLDRAISLVGERIGKQYETALKVKIVSQMRTGGKEKELFGMVAGEVNGSWIIFDSEDEFRAQVIGKRDERWVLNWIPREVRHALYELYLEREKGEKLFDLNINLLRRELEKACIEVGITPLRLHDLRKVSITWLWAMGVEMSIATEINVGWKDLNTAKRFYLNNAKMLKREQRKQYRDNIPAWYKDEDLDQYVLASLPYTMGELKAMLGEA